MENAKSILNIRCSHIHPDDPINEVPTKDIGDTCICDPDDNQWNSVNSNSRGVEFYSAPTATTSSDLCTCDEESTKNDTSAESYSYSVTCSCKNSNGNNMIKERHTTQNNRESDGTFADSHINSSTYSTTKHEEQGEEKTCGKTYSCDTTRPLLSDKLVQSKIQQQHISCDCTVPVHTTGTKIYNDETILGQTPHQFQSHRDKSCECFAQLHSTGTRNYQSDNNLSGNFRDNSCECSVQMHSTGTYNYPPDRLLTPPVTETQIFDFRIVKPLMTSPPCQDINQTCPQFLAAATNIKTTGKVYSLATSTPKEKYQSRPSSSLPASTLRPAGQTSSTLKYENQSCTQPLVTLTPKTTGQVYLPNLADSNQQSINLTCFPPSPSSTSKDANETYPRSLAASTPRSANYTCKEPLAASTPKSANHTCSQQMATSIPKATSYTCPQPLATSTPKGANQTYIRSLATTTPRPTCKTNIQPMETSSPILSEPLDTSVAIDAYEYEVSLPPLAGSIPKTTNQIGPEPLAASTSYQNRNYTRDIDFNIYLDSLRNTDTYALEPSYCDERSCSFYNITKSSTAPIVSQSVQVEKSTCNMGTTPSGRKLRSRSSLRDQNDQCAFVGSPILKPNHFLTGKTIYENRF